MMNNAENPQLTIPHVGGCYFIVLWTWYQEIPNELQKEELKQHPFATIESAAKYLGENIDRLSNEFPISKVEICFYNNR
jgi:hypothetical protein